MSLSITVNCASIPVVWYCHNPMIEEACRKHGLEYVDNNVIHTYDLRNIGYGIVTPETYGCIFYAPARFDLSRPIAAPVVARLPLWQSELAETFRYKSDGTIQMYPAPFFVSRDVGCGEMINLGLLAIKHILGITTKTLGILAIYDRKYVRGMDCEETSAT